jgi:hypothetical protein
MKYSLLQLALMMAVFSSCDNKPGTSAAISGADSTATATNKMQGLVTTCYMGVMGKDTMLLQVKRFDNVATGDLSYLFHDKDKQTGSFDARIMGDTLIGEYLYDSEGSSSSRQIAFLLSNDKAIEGSGEVMDENGTMVFVDPKKLEFGKGLNLSKVPCPN